MTRSAGSPPLFFLCAACGVLVMGLAGSMGSATADGPGLSVLRELRSHWRSVPSRVIGSPDPPPPYRVTRTLSKLTLTNPIVVMNEPGSRRLWFIDHDPKKKQSRLCRTTNEPARGEYEVIYSFGPAVAYSIAFHPAFDLNGQVFIGSNDPNSKGVNHTRITRYRVDRKPPHAFHPDSAQVIIEWKSKGHDGAAIAFGLDGMLYVTSGDGTSDSDRDLMGQGLDHLLAKVLRIDVDHPDDGRPYSVPADNPFVNREGARPETWAYGFRNPWRMSVDPQTGHLWVGNNGQDLWEQIYLVERGANYGWSVYEGGHLFYASRQLGPTPLSKPFFEHPHSEARSMTGGLVYQGAKYPELQGAYLYGDFSTGKIWGAKVKGREVIWHQELADSALAIVAFGLDADGELLIVDYRADERGGFYTLEVNDTLDSSSQFPRRLSQTGLFASVENHRMVPGMIPYSVNAPLWSDGADKERYFYLPPTAGQGQRQGSGPIGMTPSGGWSFPDGTVLVKSFGLDLQAGAAGTPHWIETRLLTKQQGEWVGYSYAWNEEQTEAHLVASEGLEQQLEIGSGNGQRHSQVWRYPSRSECMVCHSRAAGFVLGPSTLQMNKQHDYGGARVNQLEALDYLGVLGVHWTSENKSALRDLLRKTGVNEYQLDSQVEEITGSGEPRLPSELSPHWSAAFPRLVNPYGTKAAVDQRARSYLHANCAQCHVQAGGGNSQIALEFTRTLDEMNLIGKEPLHHHFSIKDARLVAPGDPAHSVLLHRMATRGRGKMPQLATSLVDEPAVELIREWIRQME